MMRSGKPFIFLFSALLLVTLLWMTNINSQASDTTSQAIQAQQIVEANKVVLGLEDSQTLEIFAGSAVRHPQCGTCYQVNAYDYARNDTVVVLVDVERSLIVDHLVMEDSQPAVSDAIKQRAIDTILADEAVRASLGYQPKAGDFALMAAAHAESERCDGSNLCLGAAFFIDSGVVWLTYDVALDQVDKIWWEPRPLNIGRTLADTNYNPFFSGNCPASGSIDRDGWTLDHSVSPTDGLKASSLVFNGSTVATEISTPEWHVDYGNYGFADYVGCSASGSGTAIVPFGETQVVDIIENSTVVGFELVQDFRNLGWVSHCNYRYEHRYQFFADGRWRVIAIAYGKGCDVNQGAGYKPIIRIDIAVNGDANDSIQSWDGTQWVNQPTEFWQLQGAPYTAEGYLWRVTDTSGKAFYIEPGQGQFNDDGQGDNAYFYATRHNSAESPADFPIITTIVWLDDERHGVNNYVNDENISTENLVLWYMPQSQTARTADVVAGNASIQYCWSDSTTANEMWPCFAGPMFVPTAVTPSAVGLGSAEIFTTHTSTITIALLLLTSLTFLGMGFSKRHGKKRDNTTI